jgi:putative CocE/NonD family hydrolase
MTGWFDFFLDAALGDFATLTACGAEPRLTISVGVHFPDATSMKIEHPEMFAWFRAATDPSAPPPRSAAVRLQLLGSKTWHDLAAWPPPATPQTLFLTADGGLVTTKPLDTQHTRFGFTTTDPTPAVGGQVMYDAGQFDNRALEQRPDVLTFTCAVREDPLTVVGVAHLSVPVSTTGATTHLFVRLTDVAPDGRSLNLADGITSFTAGAGSAVPVEIDFSATGFTIVPGHRLRLQVSSGAYPRYEAPSMAGTTTLELGPDSPAQLTLPVVAFAAAAD